MWFHILYAVLIILAFKKVNPSTLYYSKLKGFLLSLFIHFFLLSSLSSCIHSFFLTTVLWSPWSTFRINSCHQKQGLSTLVTQGHGMRLHHSFVTFSKNCLLHSSFPEQSDSGFLKCWKLAEVIMMIATSSKAKATESRKSVFNKDKNKICLNYFSSVRLTDFKKRKQNKINT